MRKREERRMWGSVMYVQRKLFVSSEGAGCVWIGAFLSLSFERCGVCYDLQYKRLHRGLLRLWRRWYRHLLKTYNHGFLQKVEVMNRTHFSKLSSVLFVKGNSLRLHFCTTKRCTKWRTTYKKCIWVKYGLLVWKNWKIERLQYCDCSIATFR